ncbi:MAG TPA: YggS family pyridoxal phosphate-dependent enzyme, partial [Allocoleopsis sp.]
MMKKIGDRITQICQQLPDTVRLIAVTKQVEITAMREAYSAGVRNFGENRVQEAINKQAQLQDLSGIIWHLIGHLQTNKVRKALQHFHWIHSVDSLNLAQYLDQVAGELALKPKICLQVKIAPDPHKYGWNSQQLIEDLPQLNQLNNLEINGLMTILPLGLEGAENLHLFKQVDQLAQYIKQQNWSNIKMQELSMGMSADYLYAIQA